MSTQPLQVSLHWRSADGRGGERFDPSVLSGTERAAARHFRRPGDSELWLQSRFLLRTVLAERLGLAPNRLTFGRGAHGKPMLWASPSASLRFNLSHSRSWVLLAVVDDEAAEVGVDIEWVGRLASAELIRAATAPAEGAALLAVPEAQRAEAFLRLWTMKESVLKAVGSGLSVPADEVVFDVPNGRLRALPTGLGSVDVFSVKCLAPPPDYLAALAVKDPLRRPLRLETASFV